MTGTPATPALAPAWNPLPWPRVRFALLVALVVGLMHFGSSTPVLVWMIRTAIVALVAATAFGVAERYPRSLPQWLPRWLLQVIAVLVVIPFATLFAHLQTAGISFHTMFADGLEKGAFFSLLGPAIVFGPWMAFGAIVRRRDALAREQALNFELERSELERQATDARLRLLQAQVQPHFLFNTLANVRALVKSGSPQAPVVLDSLIAYLRASMPRMGQTAATVGDEIALVRSYLELMHMRMPDRLQYTIQADDEALALRCPPVTLLTLVENAVRHGIDPSEEGGRIEVSVNVRDGRCIARVLDTGVGLQANEPGSGTGLDSLRERMRLAFGDAKLRLSALVPHGVLAELEFPAQMSST